MSVIRKVRFDKRTMQMDPKEELYWLHFLTADTKDPTVRDYIKSQLRHNPQYRREVLQQPVCSKCERFAFHHKNGVQCSSCGHWTPYKTDKVKNHMANGMFR